MPLLRRYRLLLIVLGLVMASLLQEFSAQRGSAPNPDEALPAQVDIGNAAAAEEQMQLREVLTDLYPDSPETLFDKGVQAMLRGEDETAQHYFDEAIGTGVKSSEDLLYVNATHLVRMHASPNKVDAAVRVWKFNYPFSTLPDPRLGLDARAQPRRSRLSVAE